MSYYCTLFDSNYLSRGLAMYESLNENSYDRFHLFIFAFDKKAYQILQELKLNNATIISLDELENYYPELKKVKSERTIAEYCWTSTPFVLKYCLEKYNLEYCTYLDADLYFFSDPKVLIEEINDKSVLITEHRYTPQYDQSKTSGIYCVQFMTFKNDYNGIYVLNWWASACLEWCYARHEDGKFGDQKYLDDWPTRFSGIHVLQHLGGGIAPWNVQQYKFFREEKRLYGIELRNSNPEPFEVVFYHFHYYKILPNRKVDFSTYRLKKDVIEYIYKPYTKKLFAIQSNIANLDNQLANNFISNTPTDWKQPLRILKRVIKGTYNVYYLSDIIIKNKSHRSEGKNESY